MPNQIGVLVFKNFVGCMLGLTLLVGCSSFEPKYYASIDAAYKIKEDERVKSHPISNSIELGMEQQGVSIFIRHRSQMFSGPPFNDDFEYFADEVGIRYKYVFN